MFFCSAHVNYIVPSPQQCYAKHPLSEEAWLELSHLLVLQSPGIKPRLLNTLRNIDEDEKTRWLERFENRHEYDLQYRTLDRNCMVHHNSAHHQGWTSNQRHNYRYYSGRYNSKLTIKFVDTEKEFEFMLDYLQVCKRQIKSCFAKHLPLYLLACLSDRSGR